MTCPAWSESRGRTFHWSGVYSTEDVNQRETLDTQLNVFAEFSPALSTSHRASEIVFLANIDPSLQMDVLDQLDARPKFAALDSMDFWIDGSRRELETVVSEVDLLFLDEGEARSFAGEINLVRAARNIQKAGPRTVVIKRGEHGVLMADGEEVVQRPGLSARTRCRSHRRWRLVRRRLHGNDLRHRRHIK